MLKSSGVRRFMRASSRAAAVACFSSAALVVSANEAQAQSVTVCYVPASGTLYLINQPGTPKKCHSSAHTELLLAASGPTGPQGPAGPQGPEGPQGPQGIAGGLSGLEFHSFGTQSLEAGPNSSRGAFRATCSADTKSVINFGFQGPNAGNPATIYQNRPVIGGPRIEWLFESVLGSVWTFYWTCADGVRPSP